MEITEDTPNVRSISCEGEPTTVINKQEEDDWSKLKHDSTVSSNEKHSSDYLLHCPKIEDEDELKMKVQKLETLSRIRDQD